MAKARIGHIAEAQILQALKIDYIDESEVLTPADDMYHINKYDFDVPFVCGARNLGEALRRIGEGASMIRTKGEAGTGNEMCIRDSVNGGHRVVSAPASTTAAGASRAAAGPDTVSYTHLAPQLAVL